MKGPLSPEGAELIARRFHALSDPTRLRIVSVLYTHGETSVRELTEALGTSQQNVSKHLAMLRDEGFVSRRKQGTSSIYAISDPSVLDLCERVCGGIEAQLDALGKALAG
ncbi:MAG TPA: metalloregulator ArsR/SmtB family transcription factor [Solirubrobacterales bacterium]|jgi:DNA-binding transcriptional ArsR family regulator|nr:metalloregulator ArsR/SmtB family transcription factor [Solirubrobacterales bacterium]